MATSLPKRPSVALCTIEKVREICAPATAAQDSVLIDCSIDFSQHDCQSAANLPNVITRKLLFHGSQASGVTADFNGSHLDAGEGQPNFKRGDIIEVASVQSIDGTWDTPRNVVIRQATVTGSIRVFGMGRNGESKAIRQSSRIVGHTQRLRKVAPSGIQLHEIRLTGTGRNPVYFAPGVSQSGLFDSDIGGVSDRVGIYLDAESHGITIRGNTINVATADGSWFGFYDRGWPQIALDGSSHNTIEGNRLGTLKNGGIYLYRNCGEGGTIRHASPSFNRIVGNVFDLSTIKRLNNAISPAVALGSRNYGKLQDLIPGSHCDDDEGGLQVGSALSNKDFASNNVVSGNLFIAPDNAPGGERWVDSAVIIRLSHKKYNTENRVFSNRWARAQH